MTAATRKPRSRAFVVILCSILAVLFVAGAALAGPAAEVHKTLAGFDDTRALAMRGLIKAQELKTVCLYGRGFGLDMPESVPEDMLIEGLWLFDYLDAMDLTGTSLFSYAAAKEHPHLAVELAAFRGFTGEAAKRALAYYDKAAEALVAAREKVNKAAQAKSAFKIETIPANPVSKGPNEAIAGDGFRLGWSWCVAPWPASDLGRYYKQHGYTPDRLFERARAYGMDYILPTDGDIFAWRVVETEKGKFDWSRADEVLARFKKYGLSIWLPLPADQSTPPKWFREELGAKATLVNEAGKPVTVGSRGGGSFGAIRTPEPKPMPPNLFDKEVQQAFARYVKALIARVRGADVPIIAVDLGGGNLGRARYGGPAAEARKKAWLAKNGRAAKMQVDGAAKRVAVIDGVRWRQHDFVEYFRPAVAAVRAVAPDLPIVVQSSPSGERNQSRDARDNELIVRELGTVPYGGSTQSIWDDMRRTLGGTHITAANTHSGGGNAFAQYAGSGFVHGSLALHTWPVPMLRGFFWRDHLMYPDLRPVWPTLFGWRRFHERAQGMGPEMRYTVPAPQAAILWSRTSDLYQSFGQDWVGGTYGFRMGAANYHRIEAVGWDRLLNMINLTHDFVTERQAAGGALSRYELLILPAVQALPANVVEAIRKFVKGGGKVIATSAPALYGDDMQKKGAGQLADVFGADFETFIGRTMIAGTSLKNTAIREAMYRIQKSPKVSDLKRTLFATFKARDGAEVVEHFTSGKPAAISNSFGKGQTTVLGYPIGREFFMSDVYHMHYGHNWQDFPNGSVFQQGCCNWVEALLKEMSFQPLAVVSHEWAPRSSDRAAGWPAWKWTRKGGGYRDYLWKASALGGHTAVRRRGDVEPRSVELAFRKRQGNPNVYMTVFSREGAYGFDPGVVHFAAISKQLKIEYFRTDVRSAYDLSAGCAVPTKIEKGRTTLQTMIEPSMMRMLVFATGEDDKIRLHEGKRQRGGSDAGLRKSVSASAAVAKAPPKQLVVGPKDIAGFLADRAAKGIAISCESPMWLPAAKKLAAAIKAKYGKDVRITRNSPRIRGAHSALSVWRDERHGYLERPDIILGNRTESHYICAMLTSPTAKPDRGADFTAPLPFVTTHTFPGPGRCAVMLTRPYDKQKARDPDILFAEKPAKNRSLIIGASDAAGVAAGVDAVIKLLK